MFSYRNLAGNIVAGAMAIGSLECAGAGHPHNVILFVPDGLRTILNYQSVGATRYFDTAGFPERTLGLAVPAAGPK